ncbi:MAG TPA: PHP domain-containing protein [Vicinamibacterales bacterium]|nr:PHP domain-containing protein [Vicinamibacterales bacterium]
MIDLHLHTTASDGRLSPAQLVARATSAGLTTISVTDHDTVAALAEVTAVAAAANIRVVSGIEITAVDDGRDVHMLGYFFDPDSAPLAAVLEHQRALRVARVREIGARLATLGMVIDVESVLLEAAARPGSSVGRPQVARELVRAGYVASLQDAFDKWLATGRPAFISRTGPSPAAIVAAIHEAGGIASMAHPGVTRRDELIGPLAEHGLDAIEVYHSDHSPEDQQHYQRIAKRRSLLVSGGSDFHGDDPAMVPGRARRGVLGVVSLPPADFAALEERSRSRPA